MAFKDHRLLLQRTHYANDTCHTHYIINICAVRLFIADALDIDRQKGTNHYFTLLFAASNLLCIQPIIHQKTVVKTATSIPADLHLFIIE